MPDSEKVINGLECRLNQSCAQCPYDEDFNCIGCDVLFRDAIVLLKAQEPIQIIKVGYNDHGRCPKCDRYVSKYSNFCWYCGQAVKWE